MKTLLTILTLLFNIYFALAQVQPVPNPNPAVRDPNLPPNSQPNIGATGFTSPLPTGSTGTTSPAWQQGPTGLSGELNDGRNANPDFNKQQWGITGPTGPKR